MHDAALGGSSQRARNITALVAAAALTAFAATAGTAAASVPGPASFSTGFVDETVFQSPIASGRSLWLSNAARLGSTWIRLEQTYRWIYDQVSALAQVG